MNIDEIKALKGDINRLRTIEAKVSEYKKDSQCDKLNFGFNVDSRFKSNSEVNIFLGGYKGYYGSSSVTSIFDIECNKEYTSAFIDVLNEMRPEILQKVADKMQAKLKERSNEIVKEINTLQALLEEANKE